jgi:tetratricopeptide (TPR) repeat protein
VTLEKMEKYEEATQIFRFILEETPTTEAWYRLGYCYDYCDQLEDSLQCYDEHLDRDPYL